MAVFGPRRIAASIAVVALFAHGQTWAIPGISSSGKPVLPPSATGADSVVVANAESADAGAVQTIGVQSSMIETRSVPVQPSSRKGKKAPVIEIGPHREMTVGEVVTIGLPGVARIAIGNGAVVKATVVDDSQLVLLAEAAGETTLHVWLKSGRQVSYDVQVRPQHYEQLFRDISDLLKDTPAIKVRVVGDRVVLEGRYPDSESVAKIKVLTQNFPQVLNLLPSKPADADPLRLERMVQIDLRVIEVKRRALDQLGIKWPGTANGPTFATNMLGYSNTPWRPDALQGFPAVNTAHPAATYFGLATQLTSALAFLEEHGDAWTMAEPRLSCRSGGESKFLAGGEIPIPVVQPNGAVSVEYRRYGVVIEFKPVADGFGNVESAIMVEVSEPDSRNSNQGYIAFTTNRAQTQVAVKEGEPLVIAGLFRDKVEKSSTSLPGLGRIPVFRYLFGERDVTTEKTELVVVATPRVVVPETAANKTAVERSTVQGEEIRQLTDKKLTQQSEI